MPDCDWDLKGRMMAALLHRGFGAGDAAIAATECERVAADTTKLASAIVLHHKRIKTLGVNNHRGDPQWGGPWDHELWATLGLPGGPEPGGGL